MLQLPKNSALSSVGLMGALASQVHSLGGRVLGIIPTALINEEISGRTVGEMREVADMHQRKALMAAHSDAFIALPGGYGTLEELLEMITWSQLGIHAKPVGVLNAGGYYDKLLEFFDTAVREQFVSESGRSIVLSDPSPAALLDLLEAYVPAHAGVTSADSWKMGYDIHALANTTPSA
eukprot:jgi/Mesen1/1053/ME000122S00046